MEFNTELLKLKKSFDPGTILFNENDKSEDLYILFSGEIEIIKGTQTVASISEQGVFFGELAAILDQPRTAAAKVSKRSEIIVIPAKNFRKIIAFSPDIAMKLMKLLAKRLADTTETLSRVLTASEAPPKPGDSSMDSSGIRKIVRLKVKTMLDKFPVADLSFQLKQIVYKTLIEKNKNNFIFAQRELADLNKKLENASADFNESRGRDEIRKIAAEYDAAKPFYDIIKEKYLAFLPDKNVKLLIEDLND
ncbi:MAG: Crp/Fnr family transcriptional regulator [Candidatus Wallbacteria bacterium]|nr:Crp/Fnr family transcriptional regulator [Candidatus Wallbacteria bacterium]